MAWNDAATGDGHAHPDVHDRFGGDCWLAAMAG